ncbi:MAG: hypothetical protein FJ098_02170 [Deltaproteobacteria bacterium]|nr:hypothetical protein [Deltaproteobacteria bacterium]
MTIPPLTAGAATADITPDLGHTVYLAGFAPDRRATGIRHPLEAGALVLRQGQEAVALVTADLVGLLRPDVEAIRRRVTRVPPERVLVCSTHTHAGPDTIGMWGKGALGIPLCSGVDPEYMERLHAAVADAVDRAAAAAAPVRALAGAFDAPTSWVTNHRRGGARYDRVTILALARDGEAVPGAVLVNFAAHPEGLWERNTEVSPDYPASLRTRLRAGGVAIPLFFNGPLGGMLTPDIPISMDLPGRRKMVDNLGEQLGDRVLQALPGLPALPAARVRVARAVESLPNRNWRFRLGSRLGVFQRDLSTGGVETEMNLVELGPLRLLTVPGEPLPELGHRLAEALDAPLPAVLALGNDELGYILPEELTGRREYRYERSMTLSPELGPWALRTARSLAAALGPAGGGAA